MAFNPDPRVRAAADYAKEFKQQHVVIIAVNVEAGELSYASYGDSAAGCTEAKRLAERLYAEAMRHYGGQPAYETGTQVDIEEMLTVLRTEKSRFVPIMRSELIAVYEEIKHWRSAGGQNETF